MASKYRKFDPRTWSDEKFVALSSDEKLVAIYCFTSRQTNRIGLFVFSPALAAEELGTLPPTFLKRFENVRQTFNWGWDERLRVLYLPSWWKFNQPENPNVLKSCLTDLEDLPQTPLLAEFSSNLRYLSETLHHTFRVTLPQTYGTSGAGAGAGAGAGVAAGAADASDSTDRKRSKTDPASQVPIPVELNTPEFLAAWGDWIADRKARNKKLTELAAQQQLESLRPLGPIRATECVRASITNTWTGIFPERFAGQGKAGGKTEKTMDELYQEHRERQERILAGVTS